MGTSYPGSLDALTNPASSDTLDSPSHSDQHINANDAIEAIQAELGTDPAGSQATVKARLTVHETPGCLRASRITSAQTIANNTSTTAIYNSNNREDDENNDISYATSTGILTINTTGWYVIEAGVVWQASTAGHRSISIELAGTAMTENREDAGANFTRQSVSTLLYITAAQTVQVKLFQTSGGNLDMDASDRSHLTVFKVR